MTLVSADETASNENSTVGRGRAEAGGVEFAVAEHGRQLASGVLSREPKLSTESRFPFTPATCVREKCPNKKRVILRVGQRRVFRVLRPRFENVEQTARFTGDERGGVAGAEGESGVVRRSSTSGCGDLESGARERGMRKFECDVVLARHGHRAHV